MIHRIICSTTFFILLVKYSHAYTEYIMEDSNICNQTIYLGNGRKSAAILRLTSRPFYNATMTKYCTVSFKVPIHSWSGMSGVFEMVDMRRYREDPASFCVDYVKIKTNTQLGETLNQPLCGTWSLNPEEPLSRIGFNKGLIGYCPYSLATPTNKNCHEITELDVIVSISGREKEDKWKNVTWRPHAGFELVITAYSYPTNGGLRCREDLVSCNKNADLFHDSFLLTSFRSLRMCVHNSFWCDGHINCGIFENTDETSCEDNIANTLTAFIPWIACVLLLSFALWFCYRRFAGLHDVILQEEGSANYHVEACPDCNDDLTNQMAIQVRVVCNSRHRGHHMPTSRVRQTIDMPPSYDTLYPQGPPEAVPTIANIITTVDSGNFGTASNSVGVNVTSTISVSRDVAIGRGRRGNQSRNRVQSCKENRKSGRNNQRCAIENRSSQNSSGSSQHNDSQSSSDQTSESSTSSEDNNQRDSSQNQTQINSQSDTSQNDTQTSIQSEIPNQMLVSAMNDCQIITAVSAN